MVRLSAFHAIAARRGDGLRPELLRLLKQSQNDAEAQQPVTGYPSNGEIIGQDEDAELLRRSKE